MYLHLNTKYNTPTRNPFNPLGYTYLIRDLGNPMETLPRPGGFRVRFGFIKSITRNPLGSEEKGRNPTRPAPFRSLYKAM